MGWVEIILSNIFVEGLNAPKDLQAAEQCVEKVRLDSQNETHEKLNIHQCNASGGAARTALVDRPCTLPRT